MIAAISTGPETHLDHLAPLCALLEIPLIVTNEEHLEMGKKFYPMVDIRLIPFSNLTLEYIAIHFDTIVTCGKFWAMELKPLIQLFYEKEIRFIFAPHGNSDKEALLGKEVEQDIDLVYGPQMRALKTGGNCIEMGNLRRWFYQEHKDHFDRLAKEFFDSEKKTVLYAPTWSTKATPTSFFESTSQIIDALADEYNLLIKLHPLLEENDNARFHRILGKYEGRARFILNFPPVYPLLEKTSVYLGDFSSIGYDFLSYNRPMFFLKEGGKLSECGELFSGSIENSQEDLIPVRKKLYDHAFAADPYPEKLRDLLKRR